MTLETSDKQKITARFPQPLVSICRYIASQDLLLFVTSFSFQHDPLDPYVEVLGCVEQDLSISVARVVNYGTDFGGCGISCIVSQSRN